MDDVIVLSDSSDTSEKIEETKCNNKYNLDIPKLNEASESDISDFEFPSVNIHELHKDYTTETKNKNWSISDFPDTSLGIKNNLRVVETNDSSDSDIALVNIEDQNNLKTKKARQESQTDSDYESQNVHQDYHSQHLLLKEKQINIDLSSDENENLLETEKKGTKRKGKAKAPRQKKPVDEEKQRKKEEREQERIRKQEEAARQKALKQLNSKNRLIINPDHSMKLMEIIFDEELEKADYFPEFLQAAKESEIKYSVESQLVPRSITWKRIAEDHYVNDKNEVCSKTRIINENHVMIIWDCEETVKHVSNDTLVSTIAEIKSFQNKKLYLVLYKIEDYFKYQKTVKDRAMKDDITGREENQKKKSKTKADRQFSNLPRVSRKKFEENLVEIQILHKVCSKLIDTEAEMVLLIHQYTKSLALLPSKLERREETSQLDWYVNTDSRDTVKVDKDGNGLKRLWQQQLCQFTLTSLETSESITSIYKSPLQLMEAYANCSPAEGEMLLRDIPIRRAAGALTSVKKIGPALSKKIYTMFTSEDGEEFLNI